MLIIVKDIVFPKTPIGLATISLSITISLIPALANEILSLTAIKLKGE